MNEQDDVLVMFYPDRPGQVRPGVSQVEKAQDRHQDEHRLHEGGVVDQPGMGRKSI